MSLLAEARRLLLDVIRGRAGFSQQGDVFPAERPPLRLGTKLDHQPALLVHIHGYTSSYGVKLVHADLNLSRPSQQNEEKLALYVVARQGEHSVFLHRPQHLR